MRPGGEEEQDMAARRSMPNLNLFSPQTPTFGSDSSNTNAHGLQFEPGRGTVSPTFALETNTQMTRSVTSDFNLGQLLTLYSQPIPPEYRVTDALKQQLQGIITSVVLPLVKFLPKRSSEAFPSYDKPDLRSPSSCELAYMVLSKCGLWNAGTTLEVRAHWWMAIKGLVKDQVSSYRNAATNYMKKEIVAFFLSKHQGELQNNSLRNEEAQSMVSVLSPKLEAVIEMAKARTLTDLREAGHEANFKAFVFFCLSKTRPAKPWKKARHNILVSDFFTVYDEAFAMVSLENGVFVWEEDANEKIRGNALEDGRKRKRRNVNNRASFMYTSTGRNARGWTSSGIQRFSELVGIVQEKRQAGSSKLLEEDVRQEYRRDLLGESAGGNGIDGAGTLNNDISVPEEGVVAAAGLKMF